VVRGRTASFRHLVAADQVIGGILMSVAESFYLILITTLIFFRWARDEEIEVPPVNLRPSAGIARDAPDAQRPRLSGGEGSDSPHVSF
jgi:hypothetical protein